MGLRDGPVLIFTSLFSKYTIHKKSKGKKANKQSEDRIGGEMMRRNRTGHGALAAASNTAA
jgi:hypothetical protein